MELVPAEREHRWLSDHGATRTSPKHIKRGGVHGPPSGTDVCEGCVHVCLVCSMCVCVSVCIYVSKGCV